MASETSNLDLNRVQMSDSEFEDFLSYAETGDLESFLDALHRVMANWKTLGDRTYYEMQNRAVKTRVAISEDYRA